MQESCIPCKHFKEFGKKYFCYRKGAFLASPNSRCSEFSLKIEEGAKKRVFLGQEEKKLQGKRREEVEVEIKPLGSEEFGLKKELTKLAPKEFYDKEIKKEQGKEEGIKSYAVVVLAIVLILIFVLLVKL